MSEQSNTISTSIRRNIFDSIRIAEIYFAGQLNDVKFLLRLFDLANFPSDDPRFKTAEGDIWQHTVNNDDFERDWVFTDPRFSLMTCADLKFLDFLCETVHPVVRSDQE